MGASVVGTTSRRISCYSLYPCRPSSYGLILSPRERLGATSEKPKIIFIFLPEDGSTG